MKVSKNVSKRVSARHSGKRLVRMCWGAVVVFGAGLALGLAGCSEGDTRVADGRVEASLQKAREDAASGDFAGNKARNDLESAARENTASNASQAQAKGLLA